MVTEWGTVDASGNGAVDAAETKAWVNWVDKFNISHLNWSVNDKAEGASVVKPGSSVTGNWAASNLTESGTVVRDIIRQRNTGSDDGGGSPCDSAPAIDLPGVVQAENFCAQNGVLTQNTSDSGGGDNVGWIQSGD